MISYSLNAPVLAAGLALVLSGCSVWPGAAPVPAPDPGDGGPVGDGATLSFPQYGEIMLVAFDFCPNGWLPADGRQIQIADNPALYSVLGTAYGGDGQTTFNIPDMRGRMPFGADETNYPRGYHGNATVQLTAANLPAHTHRVIASAQSPNTGSPAEAYFPNYGSSEGYTTIAGPLVQMGSASTGSTGAGAPFAVTHPYLVLTACIASDGYYPQHPSRNDNPPEMTDREIGDLMMTAGSYCPSSFIRTDGEPLYAGGGTLPAILYALIGDTYGGEHNTEYYNVPNLDGRSPVAANPATLNGAPQSHLGDVLGVLEQTLSASTMPAHTHALNASTARAISQNPEDNYFASFARGRFYDLTTTPMQASMSSQMIGVTGAAQPQAFSNLAPVTALNMCMAFEAEFPTRP